jgi:hypothetical protein
MPEPRPRPRQAEHNAGAFANPSGIGSPIPVPMSTLSDEYHDEPAEPEDSDRVPEPEAPGRLRRIVDQLSHRLNR